MEKVKKEQQIILNAYTLDFSKHAENKDIPRIIHIWNSIPSQLLRKTESSCINWLSPVRVLGIMKTLCFGWKVPA